MDTTTAVGGGFVAFALMLQCAIFMCWGIFFMLIMALTVGSMVMLVWMLIDAAQRPDDAFPNPGENTKLVWILIIALTGGMGGFIYYFAVYRKMGPAKT